MALPGKRRLSKTADVKKVLSRGRAVSNNIATLRYLLRGEGPSRFAFITSRQVAKKSSDRNLLRRRASEWVRKHVENSGGYDAVFVFKKGSRELAQKKFYLQLRELLERAILL